MFRYFRLQLKLAILALYESLAGRAAKPASVPSPPLQHRFHGSTDIVGYLEVGERSWRSIESPLETTGCRSKDAKCMLDFGCGSGRTIQNIDPKCHDRVMGIDIDQTAIRWCQSNPPGYQFEHVDPDPPTSLPDGYFDLIYAISVFTHLNEEMQFSWLSEIEHLLAPNGIFVASLRGDYHRDLKGRNIDLEQGYRFVDSKRKWLKPDGLPEFYQDAQHTKTYVFERWSQYFRIVDFVERGIADYHDAVILAKS